ncbi:MAG: indolepyruvate ferredoxin oxidoreductase, partial [Spirochaetaceae bacterium]|nr:indolepyruvate ferredoxin oxidoreductase [Spirochaetaceae bacterium]
FAMVPCFEPTTQQEAYEMAAEAFDVSEKYQVPVIMRMVTRLAHSRAVVHTGSKIRPENPIARGNPPEWMLLPALARKNYEKMIAKQPELLRWAEGARWNSLEMNSGRDDLAIITSGLGRNYYLENLDDYREFCGNRGLPAVVHVGTLPLPEEKILRLAETASRILVIEEGMPFIEKQLRGILPQNILPGKTEIIGKYTGHLPRAGELNPELVRKALGMPPVESVLSRIGEEPLMEGALPGRPPQLCKGCPHGDSYRALNKAVAELAGRDGTESVAVCADIGCYALGAVPPYNAVETIVCMGASIGMARGASLAGCTYTAGVIGDSTFLHSGITNLIDAVSDKTPVTVIILDNSIVAMTGCQETILPSSQLEPLVRGVGVEPEHIRVLSATPADIDKNAGVIREELEYRGVSVIIMVRECLEAFRLRQKAERAAQAGGAAK